MVNMDIYLPEYSSEPNFHNLDFGDHDVNRETTCDVSDDIDTL